MKEKPKYKVTKSPAEDAKHYEDLMKAMDMKEMLKIKRKDGYMFHIYRMIPNKDKEEWYRLD